MIVTSETFRTAAVREILKGAGSALLFVCSFFLLLFACTRQQAANIVGAGVGAVVSEICQEIEGNLGLPPDVVALTCPALGDAGAQGASGVVVMARESWLPIKARRFDAGPGK